MGYRFYKQQMAHFKVPTQFEFISNFKKPVKVNKQDLVNAVQDICAVDCSKMTIPQLQTLLSSLMVYERVEPTIAVVKTIKSKLDWQQHIACFLGVDDAIFKNLTIEKLKQLRDFLQ